jgi:hypothetical protein
MAALELVRREIPDRGVSPLGVIPRLDPGEDRRLRLGRCLEARSIQQLALERGEEALGHRVVIGIADAAHRRSKASEVYWQPWSE